VFGTRSPRRPNLIALTLCRIVSVKANVVEVETIDALADSPVLGLKPFIPGYDSAINARSPEWAGSK
jgi:tRNA (Thr-GGU) A37 N-methylase